MALDKIISITGTAVHLPGADIDTDRIILGELFRARALSLGSPPCTRLSARTRSYLTLWRRSTFALH